MKPQTPFNFETPINDVILAANNLTATHLGNLEVDGVAYSETEFDYNKVIWQGVNILPLIEIISPDAMDYINNATLNHIKDLFTNKNAA